MAWSGRPFLWSQTVRQCTNGAAPLMVTADPAGADCRSATVATSSAARAEGLMRLLRPAHRLLHDPVALSPRIGCKKAQWGKQASLVS
jgi:hypothetical protein